MANQFLKGLLFIIVGVVFAAGGLIVRSHVLAPDAAVMASTATPSQPAQSSDWVAAGPGRVEPISGEIRVVAPVAGRIENVLVRPHDKVTKGALLAVIDDAEQQARVKAAEAEVTFRESERDTAISGGVTNERRSAEDAIAAAEKEMRNARAAVDRLSISHSPADAIDVALTALNMSQQLVVDKQRVLVDVLSASPNSARPNRTDSALAIARAELGVACVALEKTKVRAPRDGTILQVIKLPGDSASTAVDDALLTMGDIDRLRVKVEIDENDLGNVSIGQHVIVRSDAFPKSNLSGVVSFIGASAHARTLAAQRSQFTARDSAMDVVVDLEPSTPALSGMRVDVFFEPTNLTDGKGDRNASN